MHLDEPRQPKQPGDSTILSRMRDTFFFFVLATRASRGLSPQAKKLNQTKGLRREGNGYRTRSLSMEIVINKRFKNLALLRRATNTNSPKTRRLKTKENPPKTRKKTAQKALAKPNCPKSIPKRKTRFFVS
jgi:hypothetical protein